MPRPDSLAESQPLYIPAQDRRRRWWFRRWPLLALALLVATLVTARFALKDYRRHVELRDTGVALSESNFLDRLTLPGMLPAYVVGTVTNSYAAAYLAFVLGMVAGYGAVGLLADVLLRLLRRLPGVAGDVVSRAGAEAAAGVRGGNDE